MKYVAIFLAICLSVLTITLNLFATSYTSKNNGNWSNSSSWNPSGVPTSGDNVTILSGNTMTINNNYTCNNIIINTGGVLKSSSGRILTIYGNFTNSGTFTYSTGTVIFSGTSSQTISGNATTFYNFTVNNSAGIIISSNINVNNTLTMTSGNITSNAVILTLGISTSTIGTLSYSSGTIITGSTGGFKRWFKSSTVSNVYFPVGTSSNLNMITLTFTAAPTTGGSLTALYIASDPGTNSSAPINDNGYTLDSYSPRGYWQINSANGFAGGTYNISLRGQGFNPFGNEITNFSHLRIIKRPAAGNNWTATGTHTNAIQYTNSDPVINRTGLSGFSQFAVGGSSIDGNPLQGPMPVELTSFAASVSGRDVKLNWVTATETNNSGFEIQRSNQNENNWINVGFVKGNGTKTTPTDYSYSDTKLNTGKYQYRLKQIDYNGNHEYFLLANIVVIENAKKYELSQNYPNPFNPTTKIDYQLSQDSKVTLKVYDISGREIMTLVNAQQNAGYYTVQFNANNLSSGNYFYKLIANSNGNETVITKKMTVIK